MSTLMCVLRGSVRTEQLVLTTQTRRVCISATVSLDSPATTVNTTLMSVPAIPVTTEQHVMTWSMITTALVVMVTLVSLDM